MLKAYIKTIDMSSLEMSCGLYTIAYVMIFLLPAKAK